MSEIMDRYVEKRVHECSVETAKRILARGKLTIGEIVECTGLSVEEVRELWEQFEADKIAIE